MADQYFRTITTSGPGDPIALGQEHNQKLNNYLKYGYAGTDAQMTDQMRSVTPTSTYKREVKSQSTAAAVVKINWYTIVTTLCCEDKDEDDD